MKKNSSLNCIECCIEEKEYTHIYRLQKANQGGKKGKKNKLHVKNITHFTHLQLIQYFASSWNIWRHNGQFWTCLLKFLTFKPFSEAIGWLILNLFVWHSKFSISHCFLSKITFNFDMLRSFVENFFNLILIKHLYSKFNVTHLLYPLFRLVLINPFCLCFSMSLNYIWLSITSYSRPFYYAIRGSSLSASA